MRHASSKQNAVPPRALVIALGAAVAIAMLVGCQRHALQIEVVDLDGRVVADAHVIGWYTAANEGEAWALAQADAPVPAGGRGASRTDATLGPWPTDEEAKRYEIDVTTPASGVAAIGAHKPVRWLLIEVWLPRRGHPSFRLDHPLFIDRRDSPDVLGYACVHQDESLTVLRLTINPDPTGTATQPSGLTPVLPFDEPLSAWPPDEPWPPPPPPLPKDQREPDDDPDSD